MTLAATPNVRHLFPRPSTTKYGSLLYRIPTLPFPVTLLFYADGVSGVHLAGIKELVTASIDLHSTAAIPDVVLQHARYLYQAMTHSSEEFQRVLLTDKLTDIAYLKNTSKSLEMLSIMYETCNLPEKVIEKQVLYMSTKLPELACIAFKALKDGYSDSWSGQFDHFNIFYYIILFFSCRS